MAVVLFVFHLCMYIYIYTTQKDRNKHLETCFQDVSWVWKTVQTSYCKYVHLYNFIPVQPFFFWGAKSISRCRESRTPILPAPQDWWIRQAVPDVQNHCELQSDWINIVVWARNFPKDISKTCYPSALMFSRIMYIYIYINIYI